MDEVTFDDYVKYVERSFFSEHQPLSTETPEVTRARMYRAVLPVRSRGEYLHELIAESATSKRAWDSVALIAQGLVQEGEPLPPELAEWVVDVLSDQSTQGDRRRPRPTKGGNPEANRDWLICLAVSHIARTFGLAPTRPGGPPKCCAEGGSACDVVGRAASKGYKNTERIWSKRDPLLSVLPKPGKQVG